MSNPDYPEKYWHFLVALPGTKKEARQGIRNDLTFADLRREVIEPWKAKRQFTVEGVVVTDQALVSDIRLVQTPQPVKVYSDQLYAELAAAGVISLVDGRLAPFSRGTDCTNQLLFGSDSVTAPAPTVAMLLQLCERLPQAARFLSSRREGKSPYKIVDEYDVQDLLHAVIRAYFKYSVDEEPLGKVGGGRSARADLALPDVTPSSRSNSSGDPRTSYASSRSFRKIFCSTPLGRRFRPLFIWSTTPPTFGIRRQSRNCKAMAIPS